MFRFDLSICGAPHRLLDECAFCDELRLHVEFPDDLPFLISEALLVRDDDVLPSPAEGSSAAA